MKRSYLVQRLEPPRKLMGEIKDNPFSFGGGLRNGGLSPAAMDLIRSIFTFDYMGSAEFEWGAVPKALSNIALNAGGLVATSFNISRSDVSRSLWDKSKDVPSGETTVYVLCESADADEVESRIRSWAVERNNLSLKETTLLASVIRPGPDWTPRAAGWLELDNGFFFFTDKAMWEKTCALFGVHTDS